MITINLLKSAQQNELVSVVLQSGGGGSLQTKLFPSRATPQGGNKLGGSGSKEESRVSDETPVTKIHGMDKRNGCSDGDDENGR